MKFAKANTKPKMTKYCHNFSGRKKLKHTFHGYILRNPEEFALKKVGWWFWISLIIGNLKKLSKQFFTTEYQLPDNLSEYKVMAYQWVQNDNRFLKKLHLSANFIHENCKMNPEKHKNTWHMMKYWPTTWFSWSLK